MSVLHARSKDERISSIAQDGGTITSMVVSALEKKIIDAAILAGTMGRWTPKPTLALTPRDALECAKSKYFYIPSLLKLGRDADAERIMIVGLPCQIRAVERLAELGVGMTHKVTYKLGLLCSHNVDYESMTMKLMMQRGINADRIVKMDIKGKLLLHDVDNKVYEIPLSTYEKLVRPSCHQCPEFLSSFSDINVGSRGALNGWNTVLVMNERGEKLFNEVADALETKQAEERVIHEVYKTDKRKKERAAEFFRDFYGSEVGGSFLDNETLRVISRGRT
ncbi:MAG: Coenzyme F420 hydrogenase/dehydrogenase, beta subunit C-terminal domain [Candidatus Nezhaarchaeota archaeon]|nr:Coenzyme F420 hydrogenase/dehydrogenase, beta subunit C-terminal domain [Candidatus Nezhaarchaeota archaeon]